MSLQITSTTVKINKSPSVDCWRLIHDGAKVKFLFQSTGITSTSDNLFCGTEAECQTEITKLKLIPLS